MKRLTAIIITFALCVTLASYTNKKADELITNNTSTVAESTEIQSQTEAENTTQEPTTEAPQTQVPTKAAPQTQKPTQKPTQAATKAPTQAPKPQSATPPKTITGFESEMLELCNQQRRANGKPDLTLNKTLCANAAVRAEEISRDNWFSHQRPDGTMCFTAVTVDYMTCGENIAYGTRTASATVAAWMDSPGHRANILSDEFTQAGFGCYELDGVRYWTQFFIG